MAATISRSFSFSVMAPADPIEVMEELNRLTGVPVPKNLEALKDLPVRFTDVIGRDEIFDYVAGKIREYEGKRV